MATSASDLFRDQKLHEAIDAQIAEVRAQPADHKKRFFLFELLCLAGDLDRAQKQIDALQFDDPQTQMVVVAYKQMLDAERQRRAFFQPGVAAPPPLFLRPPPEHVSLRVEAAAKLRSGDEAAASELIAQANEIMPRIPGSFNGEKFEAIADGDDLLAGVLEVFLKGRYTWVPWQQLAAVTMAAPKYARDKVASEARLEMANGESGEVLLPILYANSAAAEDVAIKLGHSTDWREIAGGATFGLGQHLLYLDERDVGLLELRELLLMPLETPSPPDEAAP
jgi:type VI secretion system protein ImpE